MSLPATDNFTGSDGTQLTTYSANWTLNNSGATGDFDIQSNNLAEDGGSAIYGAHWNADSFNNDQYAQAVYYTSGSSSNGIGIAVRVIGTSVRTFYCWLSDTGGTNAAYLEKVIAGVETQLGSTTAKWTNGITAKITAVGTTITPYINGSTTGTPGAQTDASDNITAGYAGIAAWGDNTINKIDDWEGGNLGSADYTISKSEGVTLGESKTVTLSDATVSKSEGVTLGEATAFLVTSYVNKSEGVTLGEAVTVGLSDLSINATDTVKAGEVERDVVLASALNPTATDGITLGESNAQSLDSLAVTQSDGITLGESATITLPDDLSISKSEGVTLGEDKTVAIEVEGEYNISVSDGLAIADGGAILMGDIGILIDPSVVALWRAGVEVV